MQHYIHFVVIVVAAGISSREYYRLKKSKAIPVTGLEGL
jgi:hypothetical protein